MGIPTTNLYVSFHGGSSGIANLGYFSASVLEPAAAQPFDELRGFQVLPVNGVSTLYVVNAQGAAGSILAFTQAPGAAVWAYSGVFTTDELNHPFDLAIGLSGYLFVSNQSSAHGPPGNGNVVTYYAAPGSVGAGTYAGTLPYTFSQLRGLAYDPTHEVLYAADTGAGAVLLFNDLTAGPSTTQIAVSKPCHLQYDGARWLYIGGEDDGIFFCDTNASKAGTPAVLLDAKKADPPIDKVAGFMFAGDYLYVANRTGNAIQRYPFTDSGTPTCSHHGETYLTTPDNPEFVLPAP